MKRTVLVVLSLAITILASITPSMPPTVSAESVTRSAVQIQHRVYLPQVTQSGPAPTSAELIDIALQQGVIDAETALIYKVFAAYDDPRLPAVYRGDDSTVFEQDSISVVLERWSTLSSTAQATLAPFIIPPYHAGSWWQQRYAPTTVEQGLQTQDTPPVGGDILFRDWGYVLTNNGKAKIWWQKRYPEDELKAVGFAYLIDNEIWSKLVSLFEQEALADWGANWFYRTPGGDGRLDIALVDLALSETTRYPIGCPNTPMPAKILFNRAKGKGELAHEIAHAFQYSFPVKHGCVVNDYKWLMEATAQYAMDYVYPKAINNEEQEAAPHLLEKPHVPLDVTDSKHEYGGYLLPFYLDRVRDDKTVVRRMWVNAGSKEQLGAVDAALPGNFKDTWPAFVAHNWNRSPVDDYLRADQLAQAARPATGQPIPVKLNGQRDVELQLSGDVQYLAAKYYHLTFPDPSVRSVVFSNPFNTGDFPTAKVQALVKIGGQWRPVEDWTNQPGKPFCRDVRAERIEELVIIFSNSEWQDTKHVLKPAKDPRLVATNAGCWRWRGTATATARIQTMGSNITETVTTKDIVFERSAQPQQESGFFYQQYTATAGTAQWNHSGHIGKCSGSGSGSYGVVEANSSMLTWSYTLASETPMQYWIDGVAPNTNGIPYIITYVCRNSSFQQPGLISLWIFSNDASPTRSISPDGSRLQGTATVPGGDNTLTWTWNLTAEAEP